MCGVVDRKRLNSYPVRVIEIKKVIRYCAHILNKEHIPVLLNEVLESLQPEEGEVVVDGTLGLGGHAGEILKRIGAKGRLIGFDCDEEHLKIAKERLKEFSESTIFIQSNFAHLKSELLAQGIEQVDAILLDLGIASPHVDVPERGFSFIHDGPLDMRLDKSLKQTAEDIVNSWSVHELITIFREYGEEKYAPKIARAIDAYRKEERIVTTQQLADLVLAQVHKRERIHPATRIFQALRIAVNRELDVLAEVIEQAIEVLAPGGRLAVISYHSLEDRIVKHRFKYHVKDCVCPREVPICQCDKQQTIRIITKKPIVPTEEEIERNSRSRSAKMRVVEKLN